MADNVTQLRATLRTEGFSMNARNQLTEIVEDIIDTEGARRPKTEDRRPQPCSAAPCFEKRRACQLTE
eukprot:scaffold368_cov258-Pinguiococcus_pyrenoidosus.AAC.21